MARGPPTSILRKKNRSSGSNNSGEGFGIVGASTTGTSTFNNVDTFNNNNNHNLHHSPTSNNLPSGPLPGQSFEDWEDDFVDYPTSPAMGDAQSFVTGLNYNLDNSESSDGWSDGSGNTSTDEDLPKGVTPTPRRRSAGRLKAAPLIFEDDNSDPAFVPTPPSANSSNSSGGDTSKSFELPGLENSPPPPPPLAMTTEPMSSSAAETAATTTTATAETPLSSASPSDGSAPPPSTPETAPRTPDKSATPPTSAYQTPPNSLHEMMTTDTNNIEELDDNDDVDDPLNIAVAAPKTPVIATAAPKTPVSATRPLVTRNKSLTKSPLIERLNALQPPSGSENSDSEDDDDDDDGYVQSALGAAPYMLKKESSRGRAIQEVSPNNRPPSPPQSPQGQSPRSLGSAGSGSAGKGHPGYHHAGEVRSPAPPKQPVRRNDSGETPKIIYAPTSPSLYGNDKRKMPLSPEAAVEPNQYLGYRGMDASRKANPRSFVPTGLPDPNDDPEAYFSAQRVRQQQQQQQQQQGTGEFRNIPPVQFDVNEPELLTYSPRVAAARGSITKDMLFEPGVFVNGSSGNSVSSSRSQQRQQLQPDFTSMKPPLYLDDNGDYLDDIEQATGGARNYDPDYDHGRDGPQYISRNPSRDPHYDPYTDPRNYPEAPESASAAGSVTSSRRGGSSIRPRPLPLVHKGEFPDERDDSELHEYNMSRPRTEDSVSYIGSSKRERQLMIGLVVCLGCALILLSALIGGLVGAKMAGGDDGKDPVPVVPPVAPASNVTVNATTTAPAASNITTGPAISNITVNTTTGNNPVAGVGNVSTATAPTTAPAAAGTTPPPATVPPLVTAAPTATAGGQTTVRDQTLFTLISTASPPLVTQIEVVGSPQQLAFLWLQEDAAKQTLSDARKIQRYALAVFYHSTGGTTWINNSGWLSSIDECVWFSSSQTNPTCASELYQNLEFLNNKISGTLPSELSLLTGLTRLSIVHDPASGVPGLTGKIPSELNKLSLVTEVALEYHAFTEALAPELFDNWPAVTDVLLDYSGIPGKIPTNIGKMAALTRLSLASNKLTGPIPTELGSLVNMLQLDLQQNALTGLIPTTFGAMLGAKGIFLNNNKLSGPIPAEMANLVTIKAGLYLGDNQLTGTLPAALSSFLDMKTLSVQNNLLGGAVPDLSLLTNLQSLFLHGNAFTGVVPAGTCTAVLLKAGNATADCPTEIACSCCSMCCAADGVCTAQTPTAPVA